MPIDAVVHRLEQLAITAFVLVAAPASAQTVRGTVTELPGGRPVRGAVVTLEWGNSDSALVERSVLTSSAGTYSINAPGPGLFRIVARRIGSQPYRSDRFTLAAGSVHVLDVNMEAVSPLGVRSLGAVSVRRASPCPGQPASGERIATLWEDARTALLSSEVAMRQRLVVNRQLRYKRELDLPSMEIRSETFTAFDGSDTSGQMSFWSPPGDELSRDGYWQETRPGVTMFYGPDANALLSEAFVRDHCFTLVDSIVAGETLSGLTFVPVESRLRPRSPPEIRGTIWFSAEQSLRRINFMWTKLRGNTRHVGGEIHYRRVDEGPWMVHSWRFVVPQEVLVHQSGGTTRKDALVEEGGLTLADSIDWSKANATVRGVVSESNGKPLAGARVRVVGTPVEAESAGDGHYVLEGVPVGLQFIVAEHESMASLGLRVGEAAVVIDSAMVRTVTFAAPGWTRIAQLLCPGSTRRERGVLRVLVRDSTSGQPVKSGALRLAVKSDRGVQAAEVTSLSTDAQGAAVFCGVVTEVPLALSTGSSSREIVLRRGEVAVRSLVVPDARSR